MTAPPASEHVSRCARHPVLSFLFSSAGALARNTCVAEFDGNGQNDQLQRHGPSLRLLPGSYGPQASRGQALSQLHGTDLDRGND